MQTPLFQLVQIQHTGVISMGAVVEDTTIGAMVQEDEDRVAAVVEERLRASSFKWVHAALETRVDSHIRRLRFTEAIHLAVRKSCITVLLLY